MGIDIHALNFLRYVSRNEPLGRVATIGRQSLMVPPRRIARIMGLDAVKDFGSYGEEFLIQELGAKVVESYDCSDYEGATFTVEMNEPFTPTRGYDTVIDCGCAEHIFDVAQALANISLLCSKGGQIVHVSPGNNFCGHGFWQFSPELFFSLYSEANGYAETEVFLADLTSERHWFEVERPKNGNRVEVISKAPLYVMCRTRKIGDSRQDNVQQSDYAYTWQCWESRELEHQNKMFRKAKRFLRGKPSLQRTILSARRRITAMMNPANLSDLNPHLRKRDIGTLLVA